jgi:hypothetical protein
MPRGAARDQRGRDRRRLVEREQSAGDQTAREQDARPLAPEQLTRGASTPGADVGERGSRARRRPVGARKRAERCGDAGENDVDDTLLGKTAERGLDEPDPSPQLVGGTRPSGCRTQAEPSLGRV